MLIYKTEKGSYHLSLDEAFKVSKTVHQVCPIMDSETYQDDVILSLEEFGNEHEKGCWIFFMMTVVFIIICVLLMFLTRG